MLPGLLVCGCAAGVFAGRKLERATYVAFRFVAADDHPDRDTIAAFRKRFLKAIGARSVEVLKLARETGVLKMGTVAPGGTRSVQSRVAENGTCWPGPFGPIYAS